MPGKRRFGGGAESPQDRAQRNIQAAAGRRLGGRVSGGGLGSAAQAGPATSPLAAKRAARIQASIGKSQISGPGGPTPPGVTTQGTPQQNARGALNGNVATIKDEAKFGRGK